MKVAEPVLLKGAMKSAYHQEVWSELTNVFLLDELFTVAEATRRVTPRFPGRTEKGVRQAIEKVLVAVKAEGNDQVFRHKQDKHYWYL